MRLYDYFLVAVQKQILARMSHFHGINTLNECEWWLRLWDCNIIPNITFCVFKNKVSHAGLLGWVNGDSILIVF